MIYAKSGLGVILIGAVGVLVCGEAFTTWRTVCIVRILMGVIGLNLVQSCPGEAWPIQAQHRFK